MKDLRGELRQRRFQSDLIQKEYLDEKETKIIKDSLRQGKAMPEGVYEDDISGELFRIVVTDLSENEIEQLLALRQLGYLRTIKNSILFFVAAFIISIIINFIM